MSVGVLVAYCCDDALVRRVDGRDTRGEPHIDAELVGVVPDRLELLARPESLGERRPAVRLVRLHAEEADGAVPGSLANRPDRRVAGHATPDDEGVVVRHGPYIPSY